MSLFSAPLAVVHRQTISSIARSSMPVLLVGANREDGENAARLIHVRSTRSAGPFTITRCGLYRGPLLEKRFFGRAAGGARSYIRTVERQQGQIELAAGGTLYVDQIQHATPLMQDRILHLLIDGTFVDPVTGDFRASDVRFIASTSLAVEACKARLLPELAERLSVMMLETSASERQWALVS